MTLFISGLLLIGSCAWLFGLTVYTKVMCMKVASAMRYAQAVLIPVLRNNHELHDVAANLENVILRRWGQWVVEIDGFGPTALVLATIEIVIGILLLKVTAPILVYGLIGSIILINSATFVSFWSVKRTEFLVELGLELVYTTTKALEMDASTLDENGVKAQQELVRMIRDNSIWDHLISTIEVPTRTIEL